MVFERTIQLIGEAGLERLREARVILFGVGGVGGWCAEALVRTGVQHLTLVDFDTVSESNLNRQVVATAANIGAPKVEEMRKRLLAIMPDADITAINRKYDDTTAEQFHLSQYDYIIDAIDTVDCKMRLLYEATKTDAVLFRLYGRRPQTGSAADTGSRVLESGGLSLSACAAHADEEERPQTAKKIPVRLFTGVEWRAGHLGTRGRHIRYDLGIAGHP